MKKIYLIAVFLLSLNAAFTQWTKIASVPSTNIVSLVVENDTIYAVSRSNMIYRSINGGVDWTPIIVSNNSINIASLIFYNNKMYVGTFHSGVFFSSNNGVTWQNNGPLPQDISGFTIKDNILYASTLGSGVAVMNPTTNSWTFLNATIPDFSINVFSIISSPDFLMIAAGSNGTFYKYDFNNSFWFEKYYDGILHPGLQINKLINNGDTVFAVNFNRIIKSANAGTSWANDETGTHDGISRFIYSGPNNYYTLTNDINPTGTWLQKRNRNAVIGSTWATNEEFIPNGFSFDIIEFNNKLFLAKADGLYFKELNDIVLPVHFILFNAKCEENKVILSWKTAQEQNSSRFDIEKSRDGIHWTVAGNMLAAGNSNNEKSYSFTDNNIVPNSSYRIAEHDLDGRVQYTSIIRSSCTATDAFSLWPNPVNDVVFINIVTNIESKVSIRIFDGKGALMKIQNENILSGSNQLNINMNSLAKGVYTLYAEWNNGQMKKTAHVLKQ